MFSWHAAKANRNFSKHGVSFEEAATLFADAEALDWADTGHSGDEPRFKRLGKSAAGRVLLTVYTVRRMKDEKETVRIISARQASRKERQAYAGRPH
ncbi:MAG: BrnT family toxin [Candidatus Dormibacteria bacterium]